MLNMDEIRGRINRARSEGERPETKVPPPRFTQGETFCEKSYLAGYRDAEERAAENMAAFFAVRFHEFNRERRDFKRAPRGMMGNDYYDSLMKLDEKGI